MTRVGNIYGEEMPAHVRAALNPYLHEQDAVAGR